MNKRGCCPACGELIEEAMTELCVCRFPVDHDSWWESVWDHYETVDWPSHITLATLQEF